MDNKKPHCLFICDKWCAGNKACGLSEFETNNRNSLHSTGLAEVATFHFDEYYDINKGIGGTALLELCDSKKPDFVCLIMYMTPGRYAHVPTQGVLQGLHNRGIPIVAIWGDLHQQAQVRVVNAISPYVTLNVYPGAYSEAHPIIKNPKTFIYLWTLKDQLIFKDRELDRYIRVVHMGSINEHRMGAINYLLDNGVPVAIRGGERGGDHISALTYATVLNEAQISLSVTDHNPVIITGRMAETLFCGAMLLQEENSEIEKLYIPSVDYVSYTSHEDMLDKAKYYLSHKEEREKIAMRGYNKTIAQYSAKKFWQTIFDKLGDKNEIV